MRCRFFALTFLVVSLLNAPEAATENDVILTALERKPFNQFQELKKECSSSCKQCNHELGVCECPVGWNGAACEQPTLPACRTTASRTGVPIVIGRAAPRNCHCYRQLLNKTCLTGPQSADRCASRTVVLWDTIKCFEYVGVPDEQQLSDLPEDSADKAKVRWMHGVISSQGLPVSGEFSNATATPYTRELRPLLEAPKHEYLPLSRCPNRCHDQGLCKLDGGRPVCHCHPGFGGEDCGGAAHSAMCANRCGGRGRCMAGFCACEAGHWGIGCARSRAYEPTPGSVHHPYYPSLKVYMYDVPVDVLGLQPLDDGLDTVPLMYQSFQRFTELFLADTSGVRTENPWEANMFFVPTFAFYTTSALGDPTATVVRAVDWVNATFPFFNRSRGRDHFVILPADRGACYLQTLPQTANLIRMVHFGLEQPNLKNMLGPLVTNAEYGCFKNGRDVLLAPYFHPRASVVEDVHGRLALQGGAERLLQSKNVLFFFAGDIRQHEPDYSGGVRQELSRVLEGVKEPDVVFFSGGKRVDAAEYESLLGRSRFCLAPYGHGWSMRLSHALMHGCVPVVLQDRVRQPWEDLLHYPDFSIRVGKRELPRLVSLLRAIPDEDVARLMRESNAVYRAFLWQPELGGLAYNYTIASLRRRLSHIRGELYEAGT